MKLFVYNWDFITKADLYAAFQKQNIQFDLFTPKASARKCAEREQFKKELEEALEGKEYDAIFSINYTPELAQAAHDRELLYICWTYDSPALGGFREQIFYDTNRIFVFDSEEYKQYKKMGVSNIYYLPLAINVEKMNRFRPTPKEQFKYRADISMVGQLYQSDMDRILPLFDEYSAGYIASLINTQLNVSQNNLFDELVNGNLIRRMCNEQVSEALVEKINDNFLHDVKEVNENVLGMFFSKAVTNKERVLLLSFLGKYFSVRLYSADRIDAPGVRNCGSIDYEKVMPIVFKCSRINLNITLRTIRCGIPQRVLDVLACRGLLLTNHQKDLDEYFTDRKDILIYESAEEALDKARYYLKHEKEAEIIRQNGYKIVKDQFSFDRQLNKIWELSGVTELLKKQ